MTGYARLKTTFAFGSGALVALLFPTIGRAQQVPAPDTTRRAPPTSNASVLTENGLGAIRVGMTAADAASALGVPTPAAGEACAYLDAAAVADGANVMVTDGRVARIDVLGATLTASNVGVGSTEAEVTAAYAGRVEAQPHKYTDGRYLVVTPADTTRRLVFETDGARVLRYRAGRRPEVEWVEGCS